ncbi:hypothetical protein [Kitasatospora sp. NPDC059327]|uniref:hypothetical protein n=1 Tax=Kitasatospora sp. NPDC059327 TaxID=3346803 RepID=UPI003696A0BE
MAPGSGDLAPGNELIIDGAEWMVETFEPQVGKVVLVPADGPSWHTSVRELMPMTDLTPQKQRLTLLRLAHLNEVETGSLSGDPLLAGPAEPRPQYDPDTTTLTQHRQAKAEELRLTAVENPDQAAALGLQRAGYRTLIRWDMNRRRFGPVGLADDRWLREATGHRISPAVRDALFAVRAKTLHRSKLSAKDRDRLIHQYVRATFGPDESVPSYTMLRTVWKEWFGSSGARQRYLRSAARAQEAPPAGR